MTSLDIPTVRSAFPALSSDFLYADNAGGSQILGDAVARISDYLLNTNVQLGADYVVSQKTTSRIASGAEAAQELFNADSVDEVAFGSSATMLVENLSRAIEKDVKEGDDIIITGEHEGRPASLSILASSTDWLHSERRPVEAAGCAPGRGHQALAADPDRSVPEQPLRGLPESGGPPSAGDRENAADRLHRVLERPRLRRACEGGRRGCAREGPRTGRAQA